MVRPEAFSVEPETETPRQRRFSVKFLLLAFVVLAIAMLPIAYWGRAYWVVSFWLCSMGASLLLARYRLAVGLLLFGLLAILLVPTTSCHGPIPRRSICITNIRQLALAVANYEVDKGHLPPPFIAGENGVPIHSWRVLILPYIEYQGLYDQYDFSKPWNHPDNLRIADQMPFLFECPSDTSKFGQQTTTYVAIVGDNTMWPAQGGRRSRDVTDGASGATADGVSKPLLIIESEACRTHWMAPNDLAVGDIVPVAKDGRTMLLSSGHTDGVVGAFIDGHAMFIGTSLHAEKLKVLVTLP